MSQAQEASIQDAQFVGFFMGEGCLDLMKSGRGSSRTPRMRIGLRTDDLAMLEWCRSRFGGSISYRAETRSASWSLTGVVNMTKALDVLGTCTLPAKKAKEVDLMREAMSLIPKRGEHIGPDRAERLNWISTEIARMHSFNGEG